MRIADLYEKCLELGLEKGDTIQLGTNGRDIKGVFRLVMKERDYDFSYVNLIPVKVIFERLKGHHELPYRSIQRWEPSNEYDKVVVSKIQQDLLNGTSYYIP